MTPQFRVNEQIVFVYNLRSKFGTNNIVIIVKKQVLFKSNTFYNLKELKLLV
jgi:hypothetical protein